MRISKGLAVVPLLVALATAPSAGSQTDQQHRQSRTLQPGCTRLFWMRPTIRHAHRVYDGTRHSTTHERHRLRHETKCQHNRHARRWLRAFIHRQQHANKNRRAHARWVRAHPYSSAYVSWYDDSGQTASGWHATYGVAVCGEPSGICVPFGTRISFCLNGCVTAVADDHGPYVAGRQFDLNQNTAQAIGFSGVGYVRYHILR